MIIEIKPKEDSLVFDIFEKVDYRDGFLISFEKDTFKNIDDFAKKYFISQPTWLRLISNNRADEDKLSFKKGESIGAWKIFERNDNEIIFGEGMGFMDYRFSMRLNKSESDDVEVSTVVKLNGVMGKYYFAVVKLMHKKFVMLSLRNMINEK